VKNIKRETWGFIALFLFVGIVLHIVGEFVEMPEWLSFTLSIIESLGYTIGIGLFVAGFVTGRILEEKSDTHKKELQAIQEAVNQDVFDQLFKSLMPAQVFQAIKDEVIKNEVVVDRATWDFDFSLGEEEDRIVLEQTLRYEMRNVSQGEKLPPIKITQADSPQSKIRLEVVEGRYENRVKNWKYDSTKDELPANIKREDLDTGAGGAVRFEIGLEIPPMGQMTLAIEHKIEYLSDVNDAYFSKYPILSGDINVRFPKGYEFGIFPSLSSRLELETDKPNKMRYHLDGVVLPKQGFAFYLKKKEETKKEATLV